MGFIAIEQEGQDVAVDILPVRESGDLHQRWWIGVAYRMNGVGVDEDL